MKLLEKIKKGLIGIGGFLFAIPTRVFAESVDLSLITVLYGPGKEPPKPSLIEIVWKVATNLLFPIVLLIGIIIYLKKAKDSRKNRIILSIGVVLLIILLYFSISAIIVEFG